MRARHGLRALIPFAAALFLAVAPLAAAASRPSVLIVLTDDQGLGDFSGEGNPTLNTPALDRFRDSAGSYLCGAEPSREGEECR